MGTKWGTYLSRKSGSVSPTRTKVYYNPYRGQRVYYNDEDEIGCRHQVQFEDSFSIFTRQGIGPADSSGTNGPAKGWPKPCQEHPRLAVMILGTGLPSYDLQLYEHDIETQFKPTFTRLAEDHHTSLIFRNWWSGTTPGGPWFPSSGSLPDGVTVWDFEGHGGDPTDPTGDPWLDSGQLESVWDTDHVPHFGSGTGHQDGILFLGGSFLTFNESPSWTPARSWGDWHIPDGFDELATFLDYIATGWPGVEVWFNIDIRAGSWPFSVPNYLLERRSYIQLNETTPSGDVEVQ